VNGMVEICDESGQTLGYFHPQPSHGESGKPVWGAPMTDEELREGLSKPKIGRPLKDIVRELETRQ
jgi:hypothetical protein